MYFYYKNKYENKSKDNEYLPNNFNLKNLKKNIIKTFSWCSQKVMMVKCLFYLSNRCPPSHN